MFKYLIVTEDFEVVGTDDIDQAVLWSANGNNIVIDVATQEVMMEDDASSPMKIEKAPHIEPEVENDDD